MYVIVGESLENDLVIKSSCICPGYILILECTVVGTPFGATRWRGNFLGCSNGIILLHNPERFTFDKDDCNDGSIVGQSLAVDGSCYISQLNITVSDDIIGKSIECYYNFNEQILVDSLTINTTGDTLLN